MAQFTFHDKTTAPAESAELIDRSIAAFGRLPGLHQVMAESPQLLDGYQRLHQLFQETSLGKEEQTVVWLSINVEHACHYCVPAHTGIARAWGIDDAIIEALRDETPLPTPRLEALRDFTLAMVRQRGELDDASVQAFLDAGFTRRDALDVILGIAQKVMSNYVNHLAGTPVDPAFARFAWTPKDKAA